MYKKICSAMIPLCISILVVPIINLQTYQGYISYANETILENDDKGEDNNQENTEKNSNIDYTKTYWNLNSLFKSDNDWKNELDKFNEDKKELKNYVGKVTKSSTHLNFALDIKEKLDIRINKLYGYVKLNQDTNKNSYKYLDMNENLIEYIKIIQKHALI